MLAVAVCPSVLVAATVYVNMPALEVPSAPGEDEPFESMHELIPGPYASAHENEVATRCPTA